MAILLIRLAILCVRFKNNRTEARAEPNSFELRPCKEIHFLVGNYQIVIKRTVASTVEEYIDAKAMFQLGKTHYLKSIGGLCGARCESHRHIKNLF